MLPDLASVQKDPYRKLVLAYSAILESSWNMADTVVLVTCLSATIIVCRVLIKYGGTACTI